jgi:hypothetical protein
MFSPCPSVGETCVGSLLTFEESDAARHRKDGGQENMTQTLAMTRFYAALT